MLENAGLNDVIGSFMFGLAMQLGGGCGSGTLFTAGSGNTKMVITLFFFIIGNDKHITLLFGHPFLLWEGFLYFIGHL